MGHRHVGERKTEAIEALENTAGVTLTDEAWDALSQLTTLQIFHIDTYIASAILDVKRRCHESLD